MKIYIEGIIYCLQKGGGITRYTDELIGSLIDLGHEVTLILNPRTSNQKLNNRKLKKIEINSILNTSNKLSRFITYPFHRLTTEKYFKNHKIREGVFHSTYFTHYKNLKIPQILTIHDLTREKFPQYFNRLNDKIFLFISKQSILKANAIVCVSHQTADDLCNYYKISSEKVNVIHLGVNKIYQLKTQKEKEDFRLLKKIFKPYILFVGRRGTYKNFKMFLKAYANWKNKNNLSIITVGGGIFNKDETDLIDKLNLKDKVINFDFVTEEELVMLYNCAESFIFPSLSEGFGLPILESMACGTPVLASNLPVFREIAGDIPYYFDPYKKESIIETLDNSLQRDQSKINAGLELVKKFTWEKTAKETLKVYEKLLKQKSNS